MPLKIICGKKEEKKQNFIPSIYDSKPKKKNQKSFQYQLFFYALWLRCFLRAATTTYRVLVEKVNPISDAGQTLKILLYDFYHEKPEIFWSIFDKLELFLLSQHSDKTFVNDQTFFFSYDSITNTLTLIGRKLFNSEDKFQFTRNQN